MSDLKPPRVSSYFGARPAEPAFFYCPFFGVNMTLICGAPFKTKAEISSGRIWIPRPAKLSVAVNTMILRYLKRMVERE